MQRIPTRAYVALMLILLVLGAQIALSRTTIEGAQLSGSSMPYPPTALPGEPTVPVPATPVETDAGRVITRPDGTQITVPPMPPDELTTGGSSPQGLRGITPTISGAPLDAPSFTVADVVAFHNRRSAVGGRGTTKSRADLRGVHFLPVRAARIQMPQLDLEGFEDTRLICILELRGTFELVPPPSLGRKLAAEGKALPVHTRAWEIYDARTGNYLSWQSVE